MVLIKLEYLYINGHPQINSLAKYHIMNVILEILEKRFNSTVLNFCNYALFSYDGLKNEFKF